MDRKAIKRFEESLPRLLVIWGVVALVLSWSIWQFTQFVRAVRTESRTISSAPRVEPVQDLPIEHAIQRPRLEPTQLDVGEPLTVDSPDDGTMNGDTTAPAPLQGDVGPAIVPAEPTTMPAFDLERELKMLLDGANADLDSNNLAGRRSKLNDALLLLPETDSRAAEVRHKLSLLNSGVFLGPLLWPEDPYAQLVPIYVGDTFARIARRYSIPPELLPVLNPQLSPRNLRPTTGIKVVFGPYHARILKSQNRLDIYVRDMYVTSLPIEIEEGVFVPRGTYRVRTNGRVLYDPARKKVRFISMEGIDESNRGIQSAWLYGSAGMPTAGKTRNPAGIRLADEDLYKLYTVLLEVDSLVRVDP